MKTFVLRSLAAASILLAPACQLLDPPLSIGRPREEGNTLPPARTQHPDTVLLVSALCFPPSYDWQKDSLFGQVDCTLRLYRGTQEALSLPAGPGTDIPASPDRHHIIDGKLYSDCAGTGGTVVCCNGKRIAFWSGSELLWGLLVKDGVLHTLGVGGGGLVYRRDGEAVLEVPSGVPFGGFRTDTYGPTGALYLAGGRVCFAFQAPHNGIQTAFIAEDGEPREVFAMQQTRLLDAKMLDGSPAVLYSLQDRIYIDRDGECIPLVRSGGIRWEYAYLVWSGGGPAALGRFIYPGLNTAIGGIVSHDTLSTLGGDPEYFYLSADTILAVRRGADIPGGCYFFSRDCACPSPFGGLALAFTPKDPSSPPYVLAGGEILEYPLHGMITSVSYSITP